MNPTSIKLGERKKKLQKIADKKAITLHALLIQIIDNFLKKQK